MGGFSVTEMNPPTSLLGWSRVVYICMLMFRQLDRSGGGHGGLPIVQHADSHLTPSFQPYYSLQTLALLASLNMGPSCSISFISQNMGVSGDGGSKPGGLAALHTDFQCSSLWHLGGSPSGIPQGSCRESCFLLLFAQCQYLGCSFFHFINSAAITPFVSLSPKLIEISHLFSFPLLYNLPLLD